MGLSRYQRFVLKAISKPELDLTKVYKLQRAYQYLKTHSLPIQYARNWVHKFFVNDREIFSKIYEPRRKRREQVLIFCHGGGWVTESVETYNKVCQGLAENTGCRVVSVEYRLAPEFPFPDGLDDCYCVTKEILKYPNIVGAKPEDIVIIGDSAGGNIAAVISMLMRDMEEFTIPKQILIYPAVNNDYSKNSPFPSVKINGSDYGLTSRHMREYMKLYVKDRRDLVLPYVAPILAEDFRNLPETLIMTAEFDPLRDEGEYYGKLLAKAGNKVRIFRMNEQIHGFFASDQHTRVMRCSYRLICDFLDGRETII